jgi:hypothetical protein
MSTKLSSLVVTFVMTPLVWLSAMPTKIFVKVATVPHSVGSNDTSNCLATDRVAPRDK